MPLILHTADWHIGQTLNGHSRLGEHRAVFDAIADILVAERVDALVVAGDVFDTANPTAEARALFFETLDRFRATRPDLVTIIIAGNHDHAAQLEAPDPLYRRAGVHVVGTVRRIGATLDLDHHLIPVGTPPRAQVLALPYPRPIDLPGALGPREDGLSPRIAAVRALYADGVMAATVRHPDLPLVLTGHLTVAGGAESPASERMILIGGEHAVPVDVFPQAAAYVALGHLHKPQTVGRANVRYSGSLFPLSATERDYDHGVTLIDLGATPSIRHIPLPRPVAFLRLPPSGAMPREAIEPALAALAIAPDTPMSARPFVHLAIAIDGPVTGLRAEIEALIDAFPVRLAGPPEFVRPSAPDADPAPPPARRLVEFEPVDLFREAFTARHGKPPEAGHERGFHDLMAEDTP